MNKHRNIPSGLLLASGSPRRSELIALLGMPVRIVPANIDETALSDEEPKAYAIRLARQKAEEVSGNALAGELVVAADTIVVDRGEILGKPGSIAEAQETLRRLKGRTHQVITALAVIDPSGGRSITDLCETDVPMRAYSEKEAADYIASGDPFDKAGAYAIQHGGFRPVERLEGCYANVVGLPLCHLTRTLREFGINVLCDVPRDCQRFLAYDCAVYPVILPEVPAGLNSVKESNEIR